MGGRARPARHRALFTLARAARGCSFGHACAAGRWLSGFRPHALEILT